MKPDYVRLHALGVDADGWDIPDTPEYTNVMREALRQQQYADSKYIHVRVASGLTVPCVAATHLHRAEDALRREVKYRKLAERTADISTWIAGVALGALAFDLFGPWVWLKVWG